MVLIWHKSGSIHLTVVLCLLLAADLSYGFVCLSRRTILFAPLNDIGLMSWLMTYGRHNLAYTAWFFVLLGLLALLCINTFVCTTDRVVRLIRSRSHFTFQRLFFRFAPHLMHYAIIIILGGYMISYLFAQVLDTRTLVPGTSMKLPNSAAMITFESFDPIHYQGDRLAPFDKWVLKPRAHLLLTDGNYHQMEVLSFNQPIRFKGYTIFLKDFNPKKKDGGMSGRVRIDMSIRKDPGVRFYIFGMILFSAGLGMYLTEWIFFRKVQ